MVIGVLSVYYSMLLYDCETETGTMSHATVSVSTTVNKPVARIAHGRSLLPRL